MCVRVYPKNMDFRALLLLTHPNYFWIWMLAWINKNCVLIKKKQVSPFLRLPTLWHVSWFLVRIFETKILFSWPWSYRSFSRAVFISIIHSQKRIFFCEFKNLTLPKLRIVWRINFNDKIYLELSIWEMKVTSSKI